MHVPWGEGWFSRPMLVFLVVSIVNIVSTIKENRTYN